MHNLYELEVQKLSGGELQRVAMCLVLGKKAGVYLIDEPSAYLDSEQRMICSKVIKRFVLNSNKTAFVVEHDFIMATYLADRYNIFSNLKSYCLWWSSSCRMYCFKTNAFSWGNEQVLESNEYYV